MQQAGGDWPGGDTPGVATHDRPPGGEPETEAAGATAPATIQTPGAATPGTTGAPGAAAPGTTGAAGAGRKATRLRAAPEAVRHLALLACYLAAGVAVTWPRATWLADGRLQATRDAGTYVWDFWWMAHAVLHLNNPWFTHAIVAPTGVQLGYHALMPLEGLLMMPVTLLFGPSASYNLLSILIPGLLCYAMYRAARLWLPTQTGAIAAGAFFGLSSIMAWHAWYQLNLAAGALFMPLALEAAVRLRRRPGRRQAVILGVVVGAALLTDQESFVLVLIIVLGALVPWLVSSAWRQRLMAAATAAVVALLVSSPQIVAMVAQTRAGGATFPSGAVATDYVFSGTSVPGMFEVSPRAVRLGLTVLRPISYRGPVLDGVLTFGLALTLLALLGLIVSWRRRGAWLLGAAWLGSAVLALGSVLKFNGSTFMPLAQTWHGVTLSGFMPFTWFVQIPGLAGFREAARLTMLGVLPAALLAGAAVEWLRRRAAVLMIPVLVFAALEAGWAGNVAVGTMPTSIPAIDRPIAADHSASIVVDVPFGVRGGVPLFGEGAAFAPESQVLATADGHPRAVGYLSRLPIPTLTAVRRNAFYALLLSAQGQPRSLALTMTGYHTNAALVAAARADVRRMHIGWVIVWHESLPILRFLANTGFRFDYAANGALVYRSTVR